MLGAVQLWVSISHVLNGLHNEYMEDIILYKLWFKYEMNEKEIKLQQESNP